MNEMFNVKLQRKASIGLFDDRFKQWATAIKTPQAPVNDVAKLKNFWKTSMCIDLNISYGVYLKGCRENNIR